MKNVQPPPVIVPGNSMMPGAGINHCTNTRTLVKWSTRLRLALCSSLVRFPVMVATLSDEFLEHSIKYAVINRDVDEL